MADSSSAKKSSGVSKPSGVDSSPSTPIPSDSKEGIPAKAATVLGDFRLLRRLGRGGMSEVYLAEQTSLKRQVAVKVLRKELLKDPMALKRFRTEATAVAGLSHPNIVQVYIVGEHGELHYMVQEYVPGQNLREYLVRKGPPDLLLAIHIMRQICLALQAAEQAGIVHRDIKPENILLTRKAEVKVADFGLAKMLQPQKDVRLTQAGITMGTPLFMSPEQIRGADLDHRSDLYSFGVTCFQMLAGEPPFDGNDPMAIAMAHLNDVPPKLSDFRPDLPPLLTKMVDKLLEKNPNDRYSSATNILKDLKRLSEEHNRDVDLNPMTNASLPAVAAAESKGDRLSTRWNPLMEFLDQPVVHQLPWMLIAALVFGAAAAGGGWWLRKVDPVAVRFFQPPADQR
ncbi:MAG: serine/threonine-protein kinase [Planctomycetales bacterium]